MPFIYDESACCDFDNPSSTCISPREAWARSTVHALERSARRSRLQVVSRFECLSSLRVCPAIPPVREPSVQGAFRCRLEPRGVEQGTSGSAQPSNFTRDRRGATRV